ncbi:MAG: FAD-dependent oxidoreductase [Smithellaceae bacterium]|nr:FAD-dependent oxidoreductase [Smithellaceae bacterium]
MKVVIVGASAAGLSCLDALQRFSLARTVTLISEEPYPPYCRCLLTHRLAGDVTPEQMTLWEPSREGPELSLLLGRRVLSLEVRSREALLDDGRRIPYDRLLLATGAEPIKPGYCDEGKNIFTLRYLADLAKIESALGPKALVIGGGLVGIKAALALKERGVAVEMLISSSYPLSQVLDRETGETIGRGYSGYSGGYSGDIIPFIIDIPP